MPSRISRQRKLIRLAGKRVLRAYVRRQDRLRAVGSATIAKARLAAEAGRRERAKQDNA